MGINVQFETDVFIKALGMRGVELQRTAAASLNEAGDEMKADYLDRLDKNQIVRTNYTKNAVKLYKSSPLRRSGEPRQLSKINTLVVINKMRGNKEHYLTKLENGGKIKGNSKTQNRVPVPLDSARKGGMHRNPILSSYRLNKNEPQTLRTPDGPIGLKGDGYRDPRQRFAVISKYRRKQYGSLSGNLSKPFFFLDRDGDPGIFKYIRSSMTMIRSLKKKNAWRRARPHFEEAFKKMSPQRVQIKFIRKARKAINNLS